MKDTVSLEKAIEDVLRNEPNFNLIAGLCKMAVEAEREACRGIAAEYAQKHNSMTAVNIADAIRARGQTHD